MRKNKFGFEGTSLIIWNKKVSLFLILFLVLVIHFLYVSIGKTIENNDLQKHGVETSGIVLDVRKVGSKGDILCTYSFKVNNALFTGSVENKDYNIGDTIKIPVVRSLHERLIRTVGRRISFVQLFW